jgi:uncharacterized protein YkwD
MRRLTLGRSIAATLALLLGACSASLDAHEPVLPPPSAAPASPTGPVPAVSPEEHNLRAINAYRARVGLGPVTLDAHLSAFALEGSRAQARERRAHGNFRRAARSGALYRVHGFAGHACENQGDNHGWTPMASVEAQIDDILAAMWREGPGGGHYDNLVHPRVRRVGIGLLSTPDGRLYLTNDFSE